MPSRGAHGGNLNSDGGPAHLCAAELHSWLSAGTICASRLHWYSPRAFTAKDPMTQLPEVIGIPHALHIEELID